MAKVNNTSIIIVEIGHHKCVLADLHIRDEAAVSSKNSHVLSLLDFDPILVVSNGIDYT